MKNETFIPVKCPGPHSGEPCHRYLTKVAFSHHGLTACTCPGCGIQWRIFHNADSPIIELSQVDYLPDYKGDVIVQVSRGKMSKDEMNVSAMVGVLACGGM